MNIKLRRTAVGCLVLAASCAIAPVLFNTLKGNYENKTWGESIGLITVAIMGVCWMVLFMESLMYGLSHMKNACSRKR